MSHRINTKSGNLRLVVSLKCKEQIAALVANERGRTIWQLVEEMVNDRYQAEIKGKNGNTQKGKD